MSPVTQEAAFPRRARPQQALGLAALPATCFLDIPVPRVAAQFLFLYKVQHIRKSKENLK